MFLYFKQKPLGVIIAGLICFSSLIQSCSTEEIDNIVEKEASESELFNFHDDKIKDQLGRRFAKNLSLAMQYPEIREFIRKETLNGDEDIHSVIFQTIKDKNVNSKGSQFRGNLTFGELIENVGTDGKINGRTGSSGTGLLDSLKALYPTLHIELPDLDSFQATNWDGKDPLKVAYAPDEFAFNLDYIEAYDIEGKQYLLDPINDPDEPVIVVGHNRRTYAIELSELGKISTENNRLESCYISNDPYYQDDMYAYYDMIMIDDCQYGGGFDDGSGSVGTGDDDTYNDPEDCISKSRRWTYNGKEQLVRFKYKDIDKFRYYHGWSGTPYKHVVTIIIGDIDSEHFSKTTRAYHPSRGDLRTLKTFSSNETKWYYVNEDLIVWDYKVSGDKWKYYWELEKSGDKITREVSASSKFSAKFLDFLSVDRTLGGSVKVESTDENAILQDSFVEYCDNTLTGTIYSLGDHFEFEVKQK